MTERLYYTDPYLSEFEARVLDVVQLPEDARPAAILDRTAFYPTSGGQPFDTGTLGSVRVNEVIDREDGTILHVISAELPRGPVLGRIDWDRRFEHMQQHTGQHVLSAAFIRLHNAETVSFHLGSAASTIDLAREVSPAEIDRAESEANRVLWEDRAVRIRFVDAAEAAQLPLRKEPAREGRLRLIEIEDFDLSACGGTHVARTGAVGIIAVSAWERFRGGTRVEFLCGGRTFAGHRKLRESVARSVRLISVLPSELPEGIERLQEEGRELKRRLKDLQGRLAVYEAEALARRAEIHGRTRVVVAALDWDPVGLKSIASEIARRPDTLAVLLSDPPSAVVIARGSHVSLDCAALVKEMTSEFGGKGGGRPELAQGGSLQGTTDEMIRFFRSLIARALTAI